MRCAKLQFKVKTLKSTRQVRLMFTSLFLLKTLTDDAFFEDSKCAS